MKRTTEMRMIDLNERSFFQKNPIGRFLFKDYSVALNCDGMEYGKPVTLAIVAIPDGLHPCHSIRAAGSAAIAERLQKALGIRRYEMRATPDAPVDFDHFTLIPPKGKTHLDVYDDVAMACGLQMPKKGLMAC